MNFSRIKMIIFMKTVLYLRPLFFPCIATSIIMLFIQCSGEKSTSVTPVTYWAFNQKIIQQI